MDYEKAYKEALERAQALYNDKNEIGYANAESVLEEVFPLLKESEDERIKKTLIRFHKSTIDIDGIKGADIVAWLEKQGREKPQRMISAEAKEAMYDKPASAWSEEDEKIALSIEQVMNCASLLNIVPEKVDKIRTWLKSLKQRIVWKPSEEQMRALHDLNLTGNISYAGQGQVLINLYNDLKKLKGE